jgi:acyl carrier protein
MAINPANPPKTTLARFPAEVLEAYERYQSSGDAGAVEALVLAAVVDYRPSGTGAPPAVDDRTRLLEDLAYDSVAVAELIFFFEDLFDLTLSNEDIIGVRSVGDLRACVMRKLGAKKRTP